MVRLTKMFLASHGPGVEGNNQPSAEEQKIGKEWILEKRGNLDIIFVSINSSC